MNTFKILMEEFKFPLYCLFKLLTNLVVAIFIEKVFNVKGKKLEFAGLRLALGFVIGILAALIGSWLGFTGTPIDFYIFLIPLRMLAWHIVFKRYYPTFYNTVNKPITLVCSTTWSCIVDIPAMYIILQGTHIGPCL